jgi:hypothetical protein
VEVFSDKFKGREKSLRLTWRLEATHSLFSESRWLVRVLCSIVQTFVLSVLHTLEYLFLGCPIALKFVGDDDAGSEALLFQQFTEEFFGGFRVTSALHQDV